jgi:hypothetical protein
MEKTKELEWFLESFTKEGGPRDVNMSSYHPDSTHGLHGLNLEEKIDINPYVEKLLSLKAFEGVKKINIIPLPVYVTEYEDKTDSPIGSDFFGGKTRTISTVTCRYRDDIKFAEEVNIYQILLGQPLFDQKIINETVRKTGVWRMPTSYDEKTLQPINEIRVVWDAEQMKGLQALSDDDKGRIMKSVENLLDSGDSNIPCNRAVLIRCSPNSILK